MADQLINFASRIPPERITQWLIKERGIPEDLAKSPEMIETAREHFEGKLTEPETLFPPKRAGSKYLLSEYFPKIEKPSLWRFGSGEQESPKLNMIGMVADKSYFPDTVRNALIHVNFSGGTVMADDQFGFHDSIIRDSAFVGTTMPKTIANCTFRDCDLRHSNFEGVHMRDVTFDGAKLDGADFRRGEFHNVDFTQTTGWRWAIYNTPEFPHSRALFIGCKFPSGMKETLNSPDCKTQAAIFDTQADYNAFLASRREGHAKAALITSPPAGYDAEAAFAAADAAEDARSKPAEALLNPGGVSAIIPPCSERKGAAAASTLADPSTVAAAIERGGSVVSLAEAAAKRNK